MLLRITDGFIFMCINLCGFLVGGKMKIDQNLLLIYIFYVVQILLVDRYFKKVEQMAYHHFEVE